MTRLVAFTAAWMVSIVLAKAALFHPVWFLLPLPFALVTYFVWAHRRVGHWVLWFSIGALLGALRLQLALTPLDAEHVAHYNGHGELQVTGVVVAEPDRRPQVTHLRVRVDSVTLPEGEHYPAHGEILVKAPPYTEAFYGDRLRIRGTLETPPVYESFSYRDYLARKGIYSLMQEATLTIEASHQASRLWEAVLRFKAHAMTRLALILPEPQASLLTGILLGVESGIPQALNEAFEATGTSHIVAISGFNLTIVAGVFVALARRIGGRKLELPLALAGVWLYTLLVGAAAAVVRAAVMGSVAILSRHAERTVHGPTSLALAAFIMSLLNPWVLWDVGFQLSLAATAGLIFFTDPLTALFRRFLRRFFTPAQTERFLGWLSEALIVTLAAQITTTPIIVAKFRRLSLVTLLTNFLILPVQPWVMLFGAVALGGALLWLPLGRMLAWLAWAFLTYTIECVRWTATFPWASAPVGRFTLLLVWGYYALLFGGRMWFSLPPDERRRYRRWLTQRSAWQLATALAFVALITVGLYSVPDGQLHVTFLDTGRGDAILVQTPRGRQLLIDGGADAPQLLSQLGRRLPFWDRRLEGVILTSPDETRLTGLVAVLERYQVERVAVGPGRGAGDHYERWQTLLTARERGTVEVLQRGALWTWEEGVWLRTLWPPEGEVGPLVLQLGYGEFRVLLAGAATTVVEESLAAHSSHILKSNVLHIPRHGAATAATPAFLQSVAPEVAVISGTPDGPTKQVLARLMDLPLYRTDLHGAVELRSDGRTVEVRTARRVP
ncbi:MAG: ComEC/Rec2 family competence protein [Anaerolineae bacterium]